MIKLTKKQASTYKRQWRQIEVKQIQELRMTPMFLKFKQLCWLMNSFRSVRPDQHREKEVSAVRKRWIRLKKRYKDGH